MHRLFLAGVPRFPGEWRGLPGEYRASTRNLDKVVKHRRFCKMPEARSDAITTVQCMVSRRGATLSKMGAIFLQWSHLRIEAYSALEIMLNGASRYAHKLPPRTMEHKILTTTRNWQDLEWLD
jgi:hypothetical protein